MQFLKIIMLLFSLSVLGNFAQAQSTDPALAYLNEVLGPLQETKDETWKYLRAATRGKSAKKVESKRQELISAIRSAKSSVRRKGGYEGDMSLKESAVNYLELSEIVLDEDFGKILDMEEIAEQSYDLMEAYILAKEKASDKINEAFAILSGAEAEFADKHGITLVEADQDKKSEKIEKAGMMLKYYNQAYLIFFKAYKQEIYALEAFQANDLNSLEQNIGAIESIVAESMERIDTLPSYNNDLALKTATKKMLKFYEREAKIEFPKLVDFMIKKEQFEEAQSNIESKSKRDRTKEDIDAFNKAVQDYNEAAESVNDILKGLDKSRNQKLNEFNKSVESFFSRNS